MIEKLNRLPKIELHLHLDGSVRPETMYELLKDQVEGIGFEEFREQVSITGECKSLNEYLEKFALPGSVMQSEENLDRITFELLEDLHFQNVKYVEIRFAPYLHMNGGLDFDGVMESVIRGMKKGMEKYPIKANLILIGMRHESPEKILELVKNGSVYLNKGVVGIDLAGNEQDFPPELHKKAINLADELGYKITIHAGETGIEKNIKTSIVDLKAKRIGHGTAAIKDKDIMDLILEEKVFLEMCPISNIQTKAIENFRDYPIRAYMDYGIKPTINTDNMTVSNTKLTREYKLLMDDLNFSLDDIKELILNSVDASFLSVEEKEKLRLEVVEELEKI